MGEDSVSSEGSRVRLRPLGGKDAKTIEGLIPDGEPGAQHDLMIICDASDGEPIGVLQYEVSEHPEPSATITWVALLEGKRRWGLGQDAVRLFEEDAVRRGVRGFRARVPRSVGLALYFWLRLGYRPAESVPDKADSEAFAMVRDAP